MIAGANHAIRVAPRAAAAAARRTAAGTSTAGPWRRASRPGRPAVTGRGTACTASDRERRRQDSREHPYVFHGDILPSHNRDHRAFR